MKSTVKKVVVFIIGSTVLLIGIIMTVLPGPAILVIPIGLGILASEFDWAARLLDYFKTKFGNAMQSWKEHRSTKK